MSVCAWGANKAVGREGGRLKAKLWELDIEPFALGFTKSGAPRHPLYIPAVATPVSMTIPV